MSPYALFVALLVWLFEEILADTHASTMPWLPAGKHQGASGGVDTDPREGQAIVQKRLQQMWAAIGIGNPVVQRIQLDWHDLGPNAGVYDTAPLTQILDRFDDVDGYIFLLLALWTRPGWKASIAMI